MKQTLTHKGAGREPVRCPFHAEEPGAGTCVLDHAAMSWHCFGCGRSGSMERINGSPMVRLLEPEERRDDE